MVLPRLWIHRSFKAAVSLFVAFSFIISSVAFADTPQASVPDTKKESQITTDPEKIVIPRDFGIVKSKYTAKDAKKLVVHIQDAHCNYEAQSNIIKILECLIKNDGLSLISVEGADGFIDTSWFKAFPDADVRKEVADYFMKKGEITGPEFLAITSDYRVKLFGAETRSYYIENLNAFTSSYPLKEDTEKYFNQIKAVLNKLKDTIYSEELKEFDQKSQDYESKKVSFTDYVKYLEELSAKHKVGLRQYENLFKLVSVLIYEKKINFNVVDKERAALIDAITKKLDKQQLTDLVNKSLEFKVSKISSAEYYDYLRNLALKYGISLNSEYPNLFNYIIYNSVYSRIENEKLFSDIKRFEDALKEKLFENDDQRTLEKLSRHINTLIGLVNIRLLNGDFDYYKEHKEEFSYEVFADFIRKMTQKFGFAFEIDPPSQAVVESMPKLEDFYAIAIKRDKALVENTVQAMEKEDAPITVLVTGGFHSEGITKLLEKQGMSYVVVCPNITKDVETPYIKILTNQRTPLEEILSDTGATTTADAKNIKGNMLAPYLITASVRTKELRALRSADIILDVWAKRNIVAWFDNAKKEIESKGSRITEEIAISAFNLKLNSSAERYVTRAGSSLSPEEIRRFNANVKEVKKLASAILPKLILQSPVIASGDTSKEKKEDIGSVSIDAPQARAPPKPKSLSQEQVGLLKSAVEKLNFLNEGNKLYFLQMWIKYIKRANGMAGSEPLRIVTDPSTLRNPNYNPTEWCNFILASNANKILSSTLSEEEIRNILGATEVEELNKNPENAATAKEEVIVTVNCLDGGVGKNVGRQRFLSDPEIVKLRGKEYRALGAKGTDLGYIVDYSQGQPVYISIAEAKIMRLVKIAGEDKFYQIRFQPVVNKESKGSYDELLDMVCLQDRFGKADGSYRPRKYRELMTGKYDDSKELIMKKDAGKGIEIPDMLDAPDFPGINVAKNTALDDKAPYQHGGHGNCGFLMLYDILSNKPLAEDGKKSKVDIRVFLNGDNTNSTINENIAGAMARKNWPIIKLTTPATPIDRKGGKDGIRIKMINGKRVYVSDQMEIKDAQTADKQINGQEAAFKEAGLSGDQKQPFNTNVFYINATVLHPILQALKDAVGEDKLYEEMSPTLIESDAVNVNGEKYYPLEGAVGTAIHNLNSFFVSSDDPKIDAIRKELKAKLGIDRLLYFVNVPRTEFFTPLKKTVDVWFLAYSHYYTPLNTTTWDIKDSNPGSNPPELDIQCADYDTTKKETFWLDVQDFINSLGKHADILELKSLKIRGKASLVDAVLAGNVSITNKAADIVDLTKRSELSQFNKNGKLHLKDITITVKEDGSMDMSLPPQFSSGEYRWAAGMVGKRIEQISNPSIFFVMGQNGQWETYSGGIPASRVNANSSPQADIKAASIQPSERVVRAIDKALKDANRETGIVLSDEIVNKIKLELTVLDTTLGAIIASNVPRRPIIIAQDTKLDPEESAALQVAQAAEAYIKEYYGNKFVMVRGNGSALLEGIDAARIQLKDERAVVVTIAGDNTKDAIVQALKGTGRDLNQAAGIILNIQLNPKDNYIPFTLLYDLAFKIAYEQTDEDTASFLNAFLGCVTNDGIVQPFTANDLKQGIIRILPRAGRIDPDDARKAYMAMAAALRSL